MPSQNYDAAIIGSGQAGGPLASALAQQGWSVALIEQNHVGGSCINTGCTPTKTLIASARMAYLARKAASYGIETGDITVQMDAVLKRKNGIVTSFRNSNLSRFQRISGLDLIWGRASFKDSETLEVLCSNGETIELTAGIIVIDTGTRPKKADIPGIEEVRAMDEVLALELSELPEHLVVLGGSYIGLEFGQMFRRFGSQVTIIETERQLLPDEDEDIADAVAHILTEEGIALYLEAETMQVRRSANGGINLTIKTPDGEREISGSHVLLAVGRTPATDALNLSAAGIKTDKNGYIQVNEFLETNVKNVYAVGDVKGGPAFTHVGYDDFRILKKNFLEGIRVSTADRMIPYVLFTDPELGRIGLTEQQALAQGYKIKVACLSMDHVMRAVETAETRGSMKVIIDAKTDKILGGAILSVAGGELMTLLQIAMMGEMPYTRLRDGIFAHPTYAEAFNNLFASLDQPA